MTAEGTFAHYWYPGSPSEQPAFDTAIFRLIRAEWCRLSNLKLEQKAKRRR